MGSRIKNKKGLLRKLLEGQEDRIAAAAIKHKSLRDASLPRREWTSSSTALKPSNLSPSPSKQTK